MIKNYYSLTKPGIIIGNLIYATSGFLLASKLNFDFILLLKLLFSISLVIASAAIFNNFLDIDIDSKMERTKKRAFVKNLVPVKNGLILGTLLAAFGFLSLFTFTNTLVFLTGFIGFLSYFAYDLAKKRTVYGTLIGSISGATPPVAGYLSVTNNFDMGAILLFLILVAWQMPHFYAIGIYRLNDYKNAGIPILPVKNGTDFTKKIMLVFILLFIILTSLLSILRFTGTTFFVVMGLLGIYWFFKNLSGLNKKDDSSWGREMFKYSLIVTIVFYILISVNVVLP